LFAENKKKKLKFASSVITLIEVLVLPLKEGNNKIVKAYESILTNSKSIDIFDLNTTIARISAKFRAEYSFKTPDAIQLATAVYCSADYFLTNDKRLKAVKEIKVITMDELKT